MGKKKPNLHIIANCANRKGRKPTAALGDISERDPQKLAKLWWKKLNNKFYKLSDQQELFRAEKDRIKAIDLYVGSYWSVIRSLPREAESAGFNPKFWIISAGYGLINDSDRIRPYSATFAKNNKDSVFRDKNPELRVEYIQNWWESIADRSLPESSNPRRIRSLIEENQNDNFLFVLSLDYLIAIEQDLLEGFTKLEDSERLVLITTRSKFSQEVLSANTIPSDARLQCTSKCEENCNQHFLSKGIRGVIGADLALKIIEKSQEWGFNATKIKKNIEKIIRQSPELITLKRKLLTDAEVKKFIVGGIQNSESASCSALLRQLRDNGYACEQNRFKKIYWEVKKRQSEVKKKTHLA